MIARRSLVPLVIGALLVPLLALAAERGKVTRVVDGDTIKVRISDRVETVRLIGVDTPESVHPNRPVEHFAKEASAFTKRASHGKRAQLEDDPQCANRDRYGRLLRYVYLPDGTILNALIISEGYGFAYTKYPFSRMKEFRKLEKAARRSARGLWATE